MKMEKMNSYSIDQLYVGQKDHIIKTITLEDIKSFSQLTSDYHPLPMVFSFQVFRLH